MPKYIFQSLIDEQKSAHKEYETAEQLQNRIYTALFPRKRMGNDLADISKNDMLTGYLVPSRQNRDARRKVQAALAQKLSWEEAGAYDKKANIPSVLHGLQNAYYYYTNHVYARNDKLEIQRSFDSIFRDLDGSELAGKSDREKENLLHEKALSRGRLIASICGDYSHTTASEMLNWSDAQIVDHFHEINHIYQLTSILQQTLDNQNPDVQFDEKTRKRCLHMYAMFNAVTCVYQRFEQILSPYYPYLNFENLATDNSIQQTNAACAANLADKKQPSELTDLRTVLQNNAEAGPRRAMALLQAQAAQALGTARLDSMTFAHPDGREFDITDPTDELIEYIHSGKPIIVNASDTQKQLCYNPASDEVEVSTTAYGRVCECLFPTNDALEALVKQMQDADPGYLNNRLYNNGSPQFNDMKEALLRFSETAKQLKSQTDPISTKQLTQLKKQAVTLNQAAVNYLSYKGNPTTDLAKRRVNAATALRNFLTGPDGTMDGPCLTSYLTKVIEERTAQVPQGPAEEQRPAEELHPIEDQPIIIENRFDFFIKDIDYSDLDLTNYGDFQDAIKNWKGIEPFPNKKPHSQCLTELDERVNTLLNTRRIDLFAAFNPYASDAPLESNLLIIATETMRSMVLKQLLVKEASCLDNKSNLIYRSILNANINDALSLVSKQDVFQKTVEGMSPRDMYNFVTTMNDPDGPMQKLATDVGKAIYKEAYLAKSNQKKQLESQSTLESILKRNGLEHRKLQSTPKLP